MVSVRIVVDESALIPGLGPRTDVTVRRNTTAAALAGALAAVLHHTHIPWASIIQAERLERARQEVRRTAERRPFPEESPASPSVVVPVSPLAAAAEAARLAGQAARVRVPRVQVPPEGPVPAWAREVIHRTVAEMAAGYVSALDRWVLGPRVGQSVVPAPSSPGPRPEEATALLILPAEAWAWNREHPTEGVQAGSWPMTPEKVARFLAWRAARAEAAHRSGHPSSPSGSVTQAPDLRPCRSEGESAPSTPAGQGTSSSAPASGSSSGRGRGPARGSSSPEAPEAEAEGRPSESDRETGTSGAT